jgi:acetyltransferase-like isoleucine patch superfamily enzyme
VHPLRRSSARRAVAAYSLAGRLRDAVFAWWCGPAFAAFGHRSRIQMPARLLGEGRIAIGDDVFVGAGSWLQALDDPHGAADGPLIEIGDGTSISGTCVLSAAVGIRLGERVLLARNVYIADHKHAFDRADLAILDQGIDAHARVEIADGAWLGQNVVVLPGARIGRGAVVGANSVVGGEVPDRCVAVGAPARVVRRLDASHDVAA